MNPVRVQRRRTKGYRTPPNTVYVGRPTKWKNPYFASDIEPDLWRDLKTQLIHRTEARRIANDIVVRMYREDIEEGVLKLDLESLRGKNLACFCPLDLPCHADVLLELANAPTEDTATMTDPALLDEDAHEAEIGAVEIRSVIAGLERAAVTMTNDDLSERSTEKRARHIGRHEAIRDAIAILYRVLSASEPAEVDVDAATGSADDAMPGTSAEWGKALRDFEMDRLATRIVGMIFFNDPERSPRQPDRPLEQTWTAAVDCARWAIEDFASRTPREPKAAAKNDGLDQLRNEVSDLKGLIASYRRWAAQCPIVETTEAK